VVVTVGGEVLPQRRYFFFYDFYLYLRTQHSAKQISIQEQGVFHRALKIRAHIPTEIGPVARTKAPARETFAVSLSPLSLSLSPLSPLVTFE